MNFSFLIKMLIAIAQLFVWIIFASSILSFFLPPYHPVRERLGRIVDPFLEPIRRVLPAAGGLDFSPLVLILIVLLIVRVLSSFL